MDASSIRSKNVEFQLKHPGTGKGIGIFIEVRPNDSDEVAAVQTEVIEEAQAAGRRGEEISFEDNKAQANRVHLAAIADIRFEGDANWNGQTSYSTALAAEMITAQWVKDQLVQQRNAKAAFFA